MEEKTKNLYNIHNNTVEMNDNSDGSFDPHFVPIPNEPVACMIDSLQTTKQKKNFKKRAIVPTMKEQRLQYALRSKRKNGNKSFARQRSSSQTQINKVT